MATEAYLQVALDGSGKKVKNLVLKNVPQPDGTIADAVYIMDVTIVDGDGRRTDPEETNGLLRKVLKEIRWIRRAFGEVTESAELMLGLDDGTSDTSEVDD